MTTEVIDKKQKLMLELLIADRLALSKCISIMKPSYFDKPLDRVVSFISDYFHKYHSCPSVDAIDAETGIELKSQVVEPHEIDYLLEEIESHCRDAAMVEAVLKAADMVEGDKKRGIPELMREALMIQLDSSIGTSVFNDPETRITTMADAIDERQIGIQKLDELIGNIRRGELGLVYAATSGGKSLMLSNFSNLLSMQGLDISIVSLELNEELYSKRLDAIIAGIDIAQHRESVEEIVNSFGERDEGWGDIVTKKMRGGTTVEDIRTYLTEYHLAKGKYPDALMVDYLALMGVPGQKNGKSEDQEDIAVGLRDLAEEFNMYVISAGQINRDGVDTMKIGPQHVSGGLSVVMTSDWAIYMAASEEDIDNNQVQVGQLKMRNAQKTSQQVTLYRCPRTLRFSDSPIAGKKMSSPVKGISSKSNPSPKDLTTAKGKDKLDAAMKLSKR